MRALMPPPPPPPLPPATSPTLRAATSRAAAARPLRVTGRRPLTETSLPRLPVAVARQAVKGMGQDARFFRDSKRGEVGELRTELASSDLDVMKDAVKKVIAAITVGKDMNALFPDVINWCVCGKAAPRISLRAQPAAGARAATCALAARARLTMLPPCTPPPAPLAACARTTSR